MSLTPIKLKALLEGKEPVRLIDVREADEWEMARISGAELIPLSQFQKIAEEKLSPEEPIIVYCHHGVRSARAQDYLKSKGFTDVRNLTGGIDAWATQVDVTMKRY